MAITVINPPPNRGLEDILGIANTINAFRRANTERESMLNDRARLLSSMGERDTGRELMGVDRRIKPFEGQAKPGLLASLFGGVKQEQPEVQFTPSKVARGTISALPETQFKQLLETPQAQEGTETPLADQRIAEIQKERELREALKAAPDEEMKPYITEVSPFVAKQQQQYDEWIAKDPRREKKPAARGWRTVIEKAREKELAKGAGVQELIPPALKSNKSKLAFFGIPTHPEDMPGKDIHDKSRNLREYVLKQMRGLPLPEQFELAFHWHETQSYWDETAGTNFAKRSSDRLNMIAARMRPTGGGGKGGKEQHYTVYTDKNPKGELIKLSAPPKQGTTFNGGKVTWVDWMGTEGAADLQFANIKTREARLKLLSDAIPRLKGQEKEAAIAERAALLGGEVQSLDERRRLALFQATGNTAWTTPGGKAENKDKIADDLIKRYKSDK